MKAASSNEIKQELKELSPGKLVDLCLRLARFKKENKELLTYLLFEADDLEQYIINVKQEMDESFSAINTSSVYFAKKSLRKILRTTNKYIRYTGSKQAEAELLLYFCSKLTQSGIAFAKSNALNNLYHAQLKKIQAVIATMHEDLQYDYLRQLGQLSKV
ncbi:MAG TPA: hypothetical protein VEV15_09165 [Flavisolibacter sp.]|nr:hypothetical protein [Flavisolibacter sp.]